MQAAHWTDTERAVAELEQVKKERDQLRWRLKQWQGIVFLQEMYTNEGDKAEFPENFE